MACDEGLAERVRGELQHLPGAGEKRMFGGVCFTLHGHMLCGVAKDALMLRLGEAAAAQALRQPHVRPMDFTGRPMKGYVFVDSAALAEDADLRRWIVLCQQFVASLPPKTKATEATQATKATKSTKAPPKTKVIARANASRAELGLPNLGPQSRAMLAGAGIHSEAQLRRLGAVAAYARVKNSAPKASLNLLWALEAALTGQHWQVVAREHRTSLLAALEEYQRSGSAARRPK